MKLTGTQSSRRRLLLSILPILLVVFFLPSSAAGQTTQITGRVADSTGAVIPGAKVIVTNTDTGVTQVITSNGEGYYTAPLLTRGTYSVTVDKSGFKQMVRSGLVLNEAQIMRLDATLEPGNVSEEIRVTSDAPLLETQNATVSTVIGNQRIDDMPTSGRNPMEFALLVPGVNAEGSAGALPVSSYGGNHITIAGSNVSENNYMIDGIAAEIFGGGTIARPLSVDATEEFRVVTRLPDAEFGRTGGGIVMLTSKSGTNQYHGDLYEFNQNTIFSANNWFTKRSGQPRSPLHFNEWGATLGGPIKKDKTFFFFNYEQFSLRSSSSTTRTVPTDLEKQGDFSQTFTSSGQLIKIYDPASTIPNPAQPGHYIRTQFPNNMIPPGRISSIAQAIQKYYPEPNATGVAGANNFFKVASAPTDSKTFGLRVDHYFTPTRRLAGRYTWNHVLGGVPNFFGNIAEPAGSDVNYWSNGAFISFTNAFSPSKFLDLRAGLNMYQPNRVTRSLGFDQTTLGFPSYLNGYVQVPSFPVITTTDVTGFGTSHDNQLQTNKAFAYLGSFTLLSGRHSWKFGSENRVYELNSTQSQDNMGFAFTRAFSQGPDPTTSGAAIGFGYAPFLLGTPASGSVGWAPSTTEAEKSEALYVQDDWKVTRSLTLNLGTRWEYEGGITDRFNQMSNWNPNVVSSINGLTLTGGLEYPGVNGVPRGIRDAEWTDFQPRAAFAWQFLHNTVVRGGYGLIYLPTTGIWTSQYSSGFSSTTSMVTTLDSVTPYNTLTSPYPVGVNQPTGSSQGALSLLGQSINGTLRNLRRGYSQQWSLSVQRQLPANWLIEVGYMGNRGVKLPGSPTFAYLPAQYYSLGAGLSQLVTNPFFGTIPSTLTLGQPTVQHASLLRLFPQFSSVSGYGTLADSIYHAGTLRVEKRYSQGVSLLLSYTFAKLIDDNAGGGSNVDNDSGSEGIRYPGDISLERSVSSMNIPQNLAISGSYDLPFGKHSSVLVKQIISGWQLNGIEQMRSGESIGITQNASTFGSSVPNLVGNPKLSSPTINMWVNKAAFADSPAYTWGNAPRNLPSTRTAAFKDLDLSMMKNFNYFERYRLQFRAEAFNFTNTPIFGDLASTNIDSSAFGTVTSLATNSKPRVIQFALKLYY